MESRAKYIIPAVFSIIGIVITLSILTYLSNRISTEAPIWDAVTVIPGNMVTDSVFLIYVMAPIYLMEFFVLSLPLALIMLVVNKVVKARWYMQSVVHIGEKFDAYRLLRRSVAPALFSLSFSEAILSFAPQWLFNQPAVSISRRTAFLYIAPVFSINGALITLAVAFTIYMPTWVLNDSGIVSHLKTEQLKYRQCPDTQSVGKWYSNYISGFALLTYPVTIFYQYFYRWLINPPEQIAGPEIISQSMIWSMILPVLMMAFVIPIVLLHEILRQRLAKPVQSLARRLGAGEIYVENLEDVMIDITSKLVEESISDSKPS